MREIHLINPVESAAYICSRCKINVGVGDMVPAHGTDAYQHIGCDGYIRMLTWTHRTWVHVGLG
jgi:hypothetical protein